MSTYNWQKPDWPHFQYDVTSLYETLLLIAEKTGLVSGKFSHLTTPLQTEAMIGVMVEEAVKTSEIEGEYISRPDIRSSIRNKLGLNQTVTHVHDKRASGVVDLLFDMRNTFNEPLTETQLCQWNLMLLSGVPNPNLKIGCWRTHQEPMQIVSSHQGRWKIHYEAPPSNLVPKEMKRFIHWFNDTAPSKRNAIKYAPVRAAIAHLYFESIHPFEDGNGRIGRAIAEKALSQGFGYPILLSISRAIEQNKEAYYAALKTASFSNEITPWIDYFIGLILSAQTTVETEVNFILKKVNFYNHFEVHLNKRQLKIIQRMMQAGPQGFKGGMSTKKYCTITKTSKATATRDLQHLVAIQALVQTGQGRSTRYELNLDTSRT